jgi:hypothetical protein
MRGFLIRENERRRSDGETENKSKREQKKHKISWTFLIFVQIKSFDLSDFSFGRPKSLQGERYRESARRVLLQTCIVLSLISIAVSRFAGSDMERW